MIAHRIAAAETTAMLIILSIAAYEIVSPEDFGTEYPDDDFKQYLYGSQ